MRPDKITIEITPDVRTIRILAGDQVITTMAMARDPRTGYMFRTPDSAGWEDQLLDLVENCPQVVVLHDLLCSGEQDLLPELQDTLQWIDEEGK